MLSFPSQNNNFFFSTGRLYLKKQTRVMANQHIFKTGLTLVNYTFYLESMKDFVMSQEDQEFLNV